METVTMVAPRTRLHELKQSADFATRDVHHTIKSWVNMASLLIKQGAMAEGTQDYENALISYIRACIIITTVIPSQKQYSTMMNDIACIDLRQKILGIVSRITRLERTLLKVYEQESKSQVLVATSTPSSPPLSSAADSELAQQVEDASATLKTSAPESRTKEKGVQAQVAIVGGENSVNKESRDVTDVDPAENQCGVVETKPPATKATTVIVDQERHNMGAVTTSLSGTTETEMTKFGEGEVASEGEDDNEHQHGQQQRQQRQPYQRSITKSLTPPPHFMPLPGDGEDTSANLRKRYSYSEPRTVLDLDLDPKTYANHRRSMRLSQQLLLQQQQEQHQRELQQQREEAEQHGMHGLEAQRRSPDLSTKQPDLQQEVLRDEDEALQSGEGQSSDEELSTAILLRGGQQAQARIHLHGATVSNRSSVSSVTFANDVHHSNNNNAVPTTGSAAVPTGMRCITPTRLDSALHQGSFPAVREKKLSLRRFSSSDAVMNRWSTALDNNSIGLTAHDDSPLTNESMMRKVMNDAANSMNQYAAMVSTMNGGRNGPSVQKDQKDSGKSFKARINQFKAKMLNNSNNNNGNLPAATSLTPPPQQHPVIPVRAASAYFPPPTSSSPPMIPSPAPFSPMSTSISSSSAPTSAFSSPQPSLTSTSTFSPASSCSQSPSPSNKMFHLQSSSLAGGMSAVVIPGGRLPIVESTGGKAGAHTPSSSMSSVMSIKSGGSNTTGGGKSSVSSVLSSPLSIISPPTSSSPMTESNQHHRHGSSPNNFHLMDSTKPPPPPMMPDGGNSGRTTPTKSMMVKSAPIIVSSTSTVQQQQVNSTNSPSGGGLISKGTNLLKKIRSRPNISKELGISYKDVIVPSSGVNTAAMASTVGAQQQ